MTTRTSSGIIKYDHYISYKDRNFRQGRYQEESKERILIPFHKMDKGDQIRITVTGDSKNEVEKDLKTLKVSISVAGSYAGIFIKNKITWENDCEAVLRITHDGYRKI